ncbi:hypothetical protein [Nonomuraea maritima]|uniref:hypothetical protein n=1 Tax=Nonomuraea maritima TaxID=683260 RepID=UPI0037114222
MLGTTGRRRSLAAAAVVAMIGLTGACGGDDVGGDDPAVVNTQVPRDDDNNDRDDNDRDNNDRDLSGRRAQEGSRPVGRDPSRSRGP